MNQKQTKYAQDAGICVFRPEPSTLSVYSRVLIGKNTFQFSMADDISSMLLEMQDSFLVTSIRFRILGEPTKGINFKKRGLVCLSINNLIIFQMPVEWINRNFKLNPEILLIGSKHNVLQVMYEHGATSLTGRCDLAILFHGWRLRNSTIVH